MKRLIMCIRGAEIEYWQRKVKDIDNAIAT
jgi:hypothetical protein